MKKILFLAIAFFTIQIVSAQESELLMETELVTSPDVSNPRFNGGDFNKFYEFIDQEFDYSSVKNAGNILVSFTVNELGQVKKIKVLEFPNVEAASEIIRVLNKSPKWEPAIRAGKPFSVEIKIPLVFKQKINSQLTSKSETIKKDLDLVKVSNDGTSSGKEFSGGLNNFVKFVSENYRQPEVEGGLFGKVIVSFVIEIDGSLVDIKVIKDLGFGTGKEAIRVLNLCPKWTPAVLDGKPVRSEFTLPIKIDTR